MAIRPSDLLFDLLWIGTLIDWVQEYRNSGFVLYCSTEYLYNFLFTVRFFPSFLEKGYYHVYTIY